MKKLKIFEFDHVMANDNVSLKVLGQGLSNCHELAKFKFYCNEDVESLHIAEMLSGLLNCHKLVHFCLLNIGQLEELTLSISQIIKNNAQTLNLLQLDFRNNIEADDNQIKILSDAIIQCESLDAIIIKSLDIRILGMSYIKEALRKIDPVYLNNIKNNQTEDDWSWCINLYDNKGLHWWNQEHGGAIGPSNNELPLKTIYSNIYPLEKVIKDLIEPIGDLAEIFTDIDI